MSQKVEIEARGSNVDAAIEAGLAKIRLDRSDVIVEVIDEGSRGLLGIGARDAVVRLTGVKPTAAPKPPAPAAPAPPKREPVVEPAAKVQDRDPVAPTAAPKTAASPVEVTEPDPEEATIAQDVLQTMLEKMHVPATISASLSEPDDLTGRRVHILDIQGEDLAMLIGTRGETLNSLQFISRLMVGHRLRGRATFVIDIQGYRQRRATALSRLAERMAQKAVQRQRPIGLEPMPPYERRIIHMALRDHDNVYTQSVGEGKRRKVRIHPK